MNELSPLLVSSIEAQVTVGSSAGKVLAAQNKDYFKLKLLETVRDFVHLLQMVKNSKPGPDPDSPTQVGATES